MSEGQQQYAPLYNQVPAGQPHNEGGYATATPVAGNPYAPQGQPYTQQGYPAQPVGQQYQTTGVPMAYAQPVGGVMVAGQPGHLPRTGQWSDGLCDCFNHCESLLVACCVAPARWAQTISRAKLMGFGQALLAFGLPWLLVYIFYIVSGANAKSETQCTYSSGWTRCETVTTPLYWAWSIAAICNMVTTILGCTYRGKLRQQFGIQGSACEDCLLYTFCPLCTMTQEARHVDRDTGYLRI